MPGCLKGLSSYCILTPTTNPNSPRNRINSGINITLLAPFEVHLAKKVKNPSKARHAGYVLWLPRQAMV